ncbi:MAG TPA: coenzyme F420-0:L-glutamate ligase [Anaerolineales bacterium]|jgi:coenzyme F420-0:L-glutamate ligase/coenzyme F420-1:gamma-L-glutamate ligase
MPLVLTPLASIPLIRQGDDLADILIRSLHDSGISPQDDDVLVVAQKIVSKAEGRTVDLAEVRPTAAAHALAAQSGKDPRVAELILRESNSILRIRPGTVIVEHHLGIVCANAGIDHSNVGAGDDAGADRVLLLPEDPDRSAASIRAKLEQSSGARLGVLIIDSHGRAWRNGTVGSTIGLSGLPGLVDLRGQQDLFGYTLQITQVGAADELAGAASLVMGQAAEGTPAVHARGFPYELREASLREILRPRAEDLFR